MLKINEVIYAFQDKKKLDDFAASQIKSKKAIPKRLSVKDRKGITKT